MYQSLEPAQKYRYINGESRRWYTGLAPAVAAASFAYVPVAEVATATASVMPTVKES
jgi:hypothetical protein